jgi:acyl-CoA dehydrogenase
MTYDCAWKFDHSRDVRLETSMIKEFATEMAWEVVDRAMQMYGAMGMSKELPLQLMASRIRSMRVYEGPSEVHKWVIARQLMSR